MLKNPALNASSFAIIAGLSTFYSFYASGLYINFLSIIGGGALCGFIYQIYKIYKGTPEQKIISSAIDDGFEAIFISTLPIYIIGADYGRYLHISYISSILIYYFLLSERIITRKSYFINFNKIIIIPILVIYSFTFTVPFCCKTMPKFNYIKLID